MTDKETYQSSYKNSWALVVGINEYKRCSPLGFACNDARAVAAVLVEKFGFPPNNIKLLLDAEATKQAILNALLAHAAPGMVAPDDRMLVFFAGHGETVTGNRGEVGYLVPSDGDCDNLATLIRWTELLDSAEMIPAKHVLFIMDACYGGLAFKRRLAPGSRRFLEDMLRRYVRQVLTAGKEDEVVADADGPRAGHSIFTGHLLDALEGAAAFQGYITANGVMAYVYDRVASDHHSDQTPHYGIVEGDGDFIFSPLPASVIDDNPTKGSDITVEVSASLVNQTDLTNEEEHTGILKEYLSEPRYRIKLDDLVNSKVRSAHRQTGEEKIPLGVSIKTGEEVSARLKAYEDGIRVLQPSAILLGKWSTGDQRSTLANMLARMSDNCTSIPLGGKETLVGMRWYPLSILMYSAGIAALSAENYEALAVIHLIKVDASTRRIGSRGVPLTVPVVEAMVNLAESNVWKILPGHQQNYAPESEYRFKALQPILEDLLFLGAGYEDLFDRYEILRSLTYLDLTDRSWAPVGRFGWKCSRYSGQDNPYTALRAEADLQQDRWGPIRAGMFRGSYPRFFETAAKFEEQVLRRVNWF